MSDINNNNQRKKSRSRWLIPAVIAIIIGFVIVQLVLLDETRDQQVTDEVEELTETSGEKEISPTNIPLRSIDEYVVFVSENNPDDNSIFVSEYIASALNYLTEALEELSEQQEIRLNAATLTQLKEQSDRISDSEAQEKAVHVKNSFIMISETMESLDLEGSEKLQTEIRTLQKMISAIDIESNIEEQDKAVSQFLEQTGIVLELIENEV
ncbi:hypothetical protein [Catalinimonas niigatensis]|uniref:hypothetical protein n=1 Tax=Catalinimonas niigatensis TaxID=1397264 RepID=UPI002665ACD9|nr:hypothetical protein [Catalinimonas niigatensis]WPP52465.1 hypothetical protein PZB72_08720 [Catalinimonas niigatensis]